MSPTNSLPRKDCFFSSSSAISRLIRIQPRSATAGPGHLTFLCAAESQSQRGCGQPFEDRFAEPVPTVPPDRSSHCPEIGLQTNCILRVARIVWLSNARRACPFFRFSGERVEFPPASVLVCGGKFNFLSGIQLRQDMNSQAAKTL